MRGGKNVVNYLGKSGTKYTFMDEFWQEKNFPLQINSQIHSIVKIIVVK